MTRQDSTLDALRAEIDRLDQEIHERLMARAELVGRIAAAKEAAAPGKAILKPGREANVMRTLLARHAGNLPRETLFHMWRELVTAFVNMQSPLVVLVAGGADPVAMWDLARGHFGQATDMRLLSSPREALDAIDEIQLAFLPLPGAEAVLPWWRDMALRDDAGRLQVVARAPFLGAPDACEALVVAQMDWEPSGQDESLVVLFGSDLKLEGLGRVLAQAANGGTPATLLAVPGALHPAQAEVSALCTKAGADKAVCLGGYALPIRD